MIAAGDARTSTVEGQREAVRVRLLGGSRHVDRDLTVRGLIQHEVPVLFDIDPGDTPGPVDRVDLLAQSRHSILARPLSAPARRGRRHVVEVGSVPAFPVNDATALLGYPHSLAQVTSGVLERAHPRSRSGRGSGRDERGELGDRRSHGRQMRRALHIGRGLLEDRESPLGRRQIDEDIPQHPIDARLWERLARGVHGGEGSTGGAARWVRVVDTTADAYM
jgi:hypothetical protein